MLIRRIVTGHDEDGRAVFVEDSPCQHAVPITGGVVTNEFWQQSGTPDNSGEYADPIADHVTIAPRTSGSLFRIVEFPGDPSVDPYLHRTASLDYCCVLDGEIFAVLDDEERLMRAGDVLVQRGTNHSWANRSGGPCRVLFVLLDAKPL